MKRKTFAIILVLIYFFIGLTGCTTGKINGIVTNVTTDSIVTITVIKQYRFKVDSLLPVLGDTAIFNPTVIRKKFNATKLNNH